MRCLLHVSRLSVLTLILSFRDIVKLVFTSGIHEGLGDDMLGLATCIPGVKWRRRRNLDISACRDITLKFCLEGEEYLVDLR